MPVKMPKGKQKNPGIKNGSPKSQKPEPEKDKIEDVVTSELEPIVSFEWHHAVAFGIFLSIYIKCTAASIPSGDAGNFYGPPPGTLIFHLPPLLFFIF